MKFGEFQLLAKTHSTQAGSNDFPEAHRKLRQLTFLRFFCTNNYQVCHKKWMIFWYASLATAQPNINRSGQFWSYLSFISRTVCLYISHTTSAELLALQLSIDKSFKCCGQQLHEIITTVWPSLRPLTEISLGIMQCIILLYHGHILWTFIGREPVVGYVLKTHVHGTGEHESCTPTRYVTLIVPTAGHFHHSTTAINHQLFSGANFVVKVDYRSPTIHYHGITKQLLHTVMGSISFVCSRE